MCSKKRLLNHNTALVLELHRRQVDNTNIARIVGITPQTVAAFIKRKSV
jgi:predicted transcriptional regulator